jgi:DNA-binding transcriptional ArsR family regulator
MVALRTVKQNVFGGLITSKTRIRILMRLFLNPGNRAYLRELVSEFGSSPSQVRDELQQLSAAGLLTNEREGRQVFYRANDQHSLFPELNSMVRKALGMDQILESIVRRLGDLERAILIDDYAEGKDTGIIDLVLIGDIDQRNLGDLVKKTERYVGRKIRVLSFTADEFDAMQPTLGQRPSFELWSRSAMSKIGSA